MGSLSYVHLSKSPTVWTRLKFCYLTIKREHVYRFSSYNIRCEGRMVNKQIILEKKQDLRLVTIRRGGTLKESDHSLIAKWAADCAQHVLHLFEEERPNDGRPRVAIEQARAWARGGITTGQARAAAFAANAAARETSGAAKEAARAAGQAVAVAHMAAHELGAAGYGIRAVRAASPEERRNEAGRSECLWQCSQLPCEIRDLVRDDKRLRNRKYWSLFTC